MLARSCGPLSPLPMAGSAPPQVVRLAGEDVVANLGWTSCPLAQNCLQARRKEEALVWNRRLCRFRRHTQSTGPWWSTPSASNQMFVSQVSRAPHLPIFLSCSRLFRWIQLCLELLTFELSPGPDPVFVGDEIIFIYWYGGFVAFTLHLELMIALVFLLLL